MKTVTVDLEDLEKIVFATSVIKTIESTMAARKNDPFVRPHLEFTEAHDRLASAMRNAHRAEAGTLVAWDGKLEEDEIAMLKAIVRHDRDEEHRATHTGLPFTISTEEKIGHGGMSTGDRLAAKSCVRMGQFIHGVIWAGDAAPSITPSARGFAVTITPRGVQKLAEAEGANV